MITAQRQRSRQIGASGRDNSQKIACRGKEELGGEADQYERADEQDDSLKALTEEYRTLVAGQGENLQPDQIA